MTNLNQIRVAWTNATGLPGVNTFYAVGDPSFLLARLKTFYEAIKVNIPAGINLTYPSTGLVIDSASGQALSNWSAVAPATTVGTGAGAYQGPTGIVVNWKTGFFVAGRELRGRTFLVPVISAAFTTGGILATNTRDAVQTAAQAVTGGGNPLTVWGKASGSTAPVTTAQVPTIAAVLRSRRD